ncbi:hypothetical protein FACS1894184_14140 [Clostridia bacterium]|nr:hypothetical protein FACS1894184_14140 [Clostridia bacterium]
MKQKITGLMDQLCSFETLYQAYIEARRGKRQRKAIAKFTLDLEGELFQLQQELHDGTYRVGTYKEFYVEIPKRRLVMTIPFRDRVVQWALYLVVNPFFERRYIFDSYGCRLGKGSLAAVNRLSEWMQHVSKRPDARQWYYLKLDISKYFYRVDHETIIQILSNMFEEPELISLFGIIINNPDTPFGLPVGLKPDECPPENRLYHVGMPIGNLSSQMIANVYLDQLDQYCKHTLKIKYYIRYMDDIIILDNAVERLHDFKSAIEEYLRDHLKLQLNRKTVIQPVHRGVEFVGYIVYPSHRKLRKQTVNHIKRSLKCVARRYSEHKKTQDNAIATIKSYFGLIMHTSSLTLRKWISKNIVLIRRHQNENETVLLHKQS